MQAFALPVRSHSATKPKEFVVVVDKRSSVQELQERLSSLERAETALGFLDTHYGSGSGAALLETKKQENDRSSEPTPPSLHPAWFVLLPLAAAVVLCLMWSLMR